MESAGTSSAPGVVFRVRAALWSRVRRLGPRPRCWASEPAAVLRPQCGGFRREAPERSLPITASCARMANTKRVTQQVLVTHPYKLPPAIPASSAVAHKLPNSSAMCWPIRAKHRPSIFPNRRNLARFGPNRPNILSRRSFHTHCFSAPHVGRCE